MKKENSSEFIKLSLIVLIVIGISTIMSQIHKFTFDTVQVSPTYVLVFALGLMLLSVVWRFPKHSDYSRIFCNIKN